MSEQPPPSWPAPTGPPTALPPPAPPAGASPPPSPPPPASGSWADVLAATPTPWDRSGTPPPPDSRWQGGRIRPWWGLGDVLLGIPVILLLALVGTFVGWAVSGASTDTTIDDAAALPAGVLAMSLVAQQLGQIVWPLVVSRWKGLGPAADWRLRFKPIDLAIGLGAAIMAFGAAALVAGVVAQLVNLTDEAQADNTQFLRDAQGTPWLYVFLLAAVVGAPVSEELLFRGLILRAFEKRAGRVVAVIGSTVAFVLPHFIGGGLAGTAVLFASIGAVGLVFALVTLSTDRLGPAIVAHMVFNGLGAASALGWFQSLGPT